MVFNVARRSMHTPMIKFLGPRHILRQAQEATQAAQSAVKALSQNCTVEFADYPAKRWARLAFSEAEVEMINQGTNEI